MLENYKRSLAVLKSLKEKSKRQESEIHEKMNENHRLKVRAAVAWEELTPRPSFTEVKEQRNKVYYFFSF